MSLNNYFSVVKSSKLLLIESALESAVQVLGPYINKVAESKFRVLAPAIDESAKPELKQIRE